MLNKIFAAIVAALGLIALVFKSKAARQEARADKAEHQAEQSHKAHQASEAANDLHREIIQSQTKLDQQHKQEVQNENESLDAGHRDQLDNNW